MIFARTHAICIPFQFHSYSRFLANFDDHGPWFMELIITICTILRERSIYSLLAMIAHSPVQSSTQTLIHNVILLIETTTMLHTIKIIL